MNELKTQEYDYIAVGERIRFARKAKKYTQEYVSEQMDVDCQFISNIERGVCGLSITTLIDLCKVLDTSADYILFGEAFGNTPIDSIYQKMNQKQKLYVEETVRLYAESIGIN